MAARVTSPFSFRRDRAGKPSSRRNAPTAEALEIRRLLSYAPFRTFGMDALPGDASAADLPAKGTPVRAAAGSRHLAHPIDRAPGAGSPVPIAEAEPRGTEGQNDTHATAQFLNGFGTGAGDYAAADVRGSAESFQPVTPREDDGSIPRANATGSMAGATGAFDAEGRIGDGPHGSAGTGTGDYDHYAFSASAGQLLTVWVSAFWLGSPLDAAVAVYDSSGAIVASNDNEWDNPAYGFSPDPFLHILLPASDTYSVAVYGSGSGFQTNPFDSASGGGAASEGFYRLDIFVESPLLVSPAEDDGAIPLANDTGLRAESGGLAFARATIGDGPHGSAGTGTGDFDFYRLEAAAGQRIVVDTDTPVPLEGVDTAVGIYDSAGNLLAFNDDDLRTFDSYLLFEAPATGTYFVIVSVFPGLLPDDPFDPASGSGVGSEGDYSVIITVANPAASDYYSFDLEAGDIIGAALFEGADRLNLYGPDGTLLVGTNYDFITFYKPASSPLPGSEGRTNTAIAYVINSPGTYTLEVSDGYAAYTTELRAFRPVLEQQPVFSHQILFVDFDGATLTPEDYRPELGINPHAMLSPLSSFLGAFGLAASDESAVIDAILATVVENYAQDVSGVVGRGRNGDFQITGRAGEFQIEILNSRDHPDPFGLYPNVSRVIVGGTQAQLGGAPVLAISPTIDVGNFDTSETAVVLLDRLSQFIPGLPRAPGATLIDLIGVITGNVTSHESGHFFGNWHTDPFTDPIDFLNLMARPAFLADFGRDGLFGTPDDGDLDFGLSDYSRHPQEVFDGVEDTLNTIAFGLSTGTKAGTYFDFVNGTLYVSGNIDDGHKDELQVRAVGANLEVLINGSLADTRPAAGIQRIFFNGSGDRDILDASGLGVPVIMMGRGGEDRLTGGGAGDLLIGGRASDKLEGGGGDDILISSQTAFDNDAAALRAILAEWTSPRDYATRVANLSGSGTGPRLNGDHFLTATGPQATVFDDGNEDKLTANQGRDWFFARLRRDELTDRQGNEVLTTL